MSKKFNNPGDKISKSFCALPWLHLHNWPDGKVYPCCLTDFREPIGHVKDNTLEELWNVPKMKEIRKYKLEGKKHNSCRKCFEQEDNGVQSMRIAANQLYEKHFDNIVDTTRPDGHSDDFKLIYWDFRFSNLCNFKCRMCGSALSSKWYDDEINIYGHSDQDRALIHVNDYSKKNINAYVDEFIKDVEEVYFAGGEPLLMDEHYMILEKLIEVGNTDCRIRYNTNFSKLKFKQWDILELWKNFTVKDKNNVRIFASIDGFGPLSEYVRKGTNWPLVEKNIIKTLDEGFVFDLSCTVSLLNVFHIPDFVDKMVSLGVPYYGIHLNNILTFPEYYHLNSLPNNLKLDARDNLLSHLETIPEPHRPEFKEKYSSIINFMDVDGTEDRTETNIQLKSVISKVDVYRKESFVEIYPQYKEWYEGIKFIDKTEKTI